MLAFEKLAPILCVLVACAAEPGDDPPVEAQETEGATQMSPDTTDPAAETDTDPEPETDTEPEPEPEPEPDTDTDDDPGVCAEPDPAVEDCCCFADPEAPRCASEELCGVIEAACPDTEYGDCERAELEVDPAQAEDVVCALEAIRDGAVGQIRWERVGADLPGYAGRDVWLDLNADGPAFVRVLDYEDLGAEFDVYSGSLPADFDAAGCLELATASEQFACFEAVLDLEAQTICVEDYIIDFE